MKKIFLILISFYSAGSGLAKTTQIKNHFYPKEAIIQAILDHKQLQQYFHPEIPGRVPLVLSNHGIPRRLKLKKFNKDVLIVADRKIKGAYLRFTLFDCKNGNYCNIAFEYPIEKVTGGTGVYISSDGSFQLEKTEISER